ncbi:signal recognition particle subunit [Conoideocrella luteorostrata]|uniref:Signal recognition particle subunit n=1 Tax=Conoideocrella luteorostrata TaxID=1105319 RepID=A0AAJ0CBM7_9HYPO|nr:signal recognition particle subunit [Conoideocrella luteorostrata]
MSHPRVEEVSDSDSDVVSDPGELDIDDFVDSDIMRRVPPTTAAAAAAKPPPAISPASLPSSSFVHDADRSAYNNFQCLYPVYFDASRSRAQGRRVSSSLAVKNPLAREIATACSRLRLPTLLEPEKTHPKDWANPGRVKVGLKSSKAAGHVANKHHLYVLVAKHLQENPTTENSAGLRVRMGGQVQPPEGSPYPRPAVPRGWAMGEFVPYLSPAMTGGGVSENLLKDMMNEMQGGGDPMSALMGAMGGGSGGGGGGEEPATSGGGTGGKKKKDKKGKGRS